MKRNSFASGPYSVVRNLEARHRLQRSTRVSRGFHRSRAKQRFHGTATHAAATPRNCCLVLAPCPRLLSPDDAGGYPAVATSRVPRNIKQAGVPTSSHPYVRPGLKHNTHLPLPVLFAAAFSVISVFSMLHNAPQHKPLTGYCSCMFMMIVALISVIILLTFVGDIWRIRTSTTVHATVQAWKRPRPLGQQQTGRQATQWEQAARANLSSYRGGLLSHVRPYYGKKDFWTVFLPVISCPPDRPLTRYGGTGDGSKLLCKLSDQMQQEGCIVYSLGSKGKLGVCYRLLSHCTLSSVYQGPAGV